MLRFLVVSLPLFAILRLAPAIVLAGPAAIAAFALHVLGVISDPQTSMVGGAVRFDSIDLVLEDPSLLGGMPLLVGLWIARGGRPAWLGLLGAALLLELLAAIVFALTATCCVRHVTDTLRIDSPVEFLAMASIAVIRVYPVAIPFLPRIRAPQGSRERRTPSRSR